VEGAVVIISVVREATEAMAFSNQSLSVLSVSSSLSVTLSVSSLVGLYDGSEAGAMSMWLS